MQPCDPGQGLLGQIPFCGRGVALAVLHLGHVRLTELVSRADGIRCYLGKGKPTQGPQLLEALP